MGWMQRLKNGFARLMYGRNGLDQLGLAMIWTFLALDVLSIAARRFSPLVGAVLYWAGTVLWLAAFFRIFSKNLYRRREENSRWMQFWWKLRSGAQGAKARHADKEHKYFTCRNCKTICRVPMGKGKVEITCPKCGAKIYGKT